MLDFMESFDERQIRYAGPEFRRLIELTAQKAHRVSQVSHLFGNIVLGDNCLTTFLAFRSYLSDQISHTTRGQVGLDLHIITYNPCHFMPRSPCLYRSVARTRPQYLLLPFHHKQIRRKYHVSLSLLTS